MAKIAIESSVFANVVSYMQGVESLLAKRATAEDMIVTEGPGIMDALVSANVIPTATKAASAAKLKEDPAYAVELLSKMAKAMQVSSAVGTGVDTVKSAGTELSADEAFERELTK